jgi:hypothetical protein
LILAAAALQAAPAPAAIAKPVRWTASPLKDALEQPLPPAVSYEVWLTVEGLPEALAASVTDTSWTLQAQPGTTYRVRVRGVCALGIKSAFSDLSEPWQAPVAAAAASTSPAGLGPARPNPFNARTSIVYLVPGDLPAGAVLALDIYDVRGRHIRSLDLDRRSGTHEVAWNGEDAGGRAVPAGMYLVKFVCGSQQASLKLALLP